MAAAATFSFGVLSTICSLFGADAELRGDLDYKIPTALQRQLATASVSVPTQPGIPPGLAGFDLGGVRFISIDNIEDLHCYLDAAAVPEIGSRIAATVVESSLESGLSSDEQESSRMRQRFFCRMDVADGRTHRALPQIRIPRQVVPPHVVKLSLSRRGPVKAGPRMRAADVALLGITLDQIRRHLDTQTVEIVTGQTMPSPRGGMMILEGI